MMIFLGASQLLSYGNQATAGNPFDQKVYLPGDFFEYIFKGRGPVPQYSEFVKSLDWKEENYPDTANTYWIKERFEQQMLVRMRYCIDNVNDANFLHKHASDCNRVARSLFELDAPIPKLESSKNAGPRMKEWNNGRWAGKYHQEIKQYKKIFKETIQPPHHPSYQRHDPQ